MSTEDQEVEELMGRVSQLELQAKKLVTETFAGDYQSSFKGRGLDFDDYREYQAGDEIRFIDWNVTARTGEPFVRTFKEERELSVVLMVDISASTHYGSTSRSKRGLAAEIAAIIAFSAVSNNDQVSLLLFADKPLHYLLPGKGTKHVLRIIRDILAAKPEQGGADLKEACRYLNGLHPRKSLVFLLSDFLDYNLGKSLTATAQRHDLTALRLQDPAEARLPKAGKVALYDPEQGYETIVNTNHASVRMAYHKLRQRFEEGLSRYFKTNAVDYGVFTTDEEVFPQLRQLFQSRIGRRG